MASKVVAEMVRGWAAGDEWEGFVYCFNGVLSRFKSIRPTCGRCSRLNQLYKWIHYQNKRKISHDLRVMTRICVQLNVADAQRQVVQALMELNLVLEHAHTQQSLTTQYIYSLHLTRLSYRLYIILHIKSSCLQHTKTHIPWHTSTSRKLNSSVLWFCLWDVDSIPSKLIP